MWLGLLCCLGEALGVSEMAEEVDLWLNTCHVRDGLGVDTLVSLALCSP